MAFRHELLNAIENLSRRRGFVHQTSLMYGGMEGRYEYGPLGSLLKQNISKQWWQHTVTSRENVFGMDSSIVQHQSTWEASGHRERFGDRMVRNILTGSSFKVSSAPKVAGLEKDSIVLKASSKKEVKAWRERLRTDLAPGAKTFTEDTTITLGVRDVNDTHLILNGTEGDVHVAHQGVLCPETNSPFLSEPWMHHGMQYSSALSPDGLAAVLAETARNNPDASQKELTSLFEADIMKHSRPLRPELAQSVFTQWPMLSNSVDKQFPVAFAQVGKAFRNEQSCGPFIYRLMEFEQMECYHFCRPSESDKFFLDLSVDRLSWWRSMARNPLNFKSVELEKNDLAHYASSAIDMEYEFPWGSEEVESIANRTDFDLLQHQKVHGKSMEQIDSVQGDTKKSFVPHCVESSTGLDRALMAYLCDSYSTRETSYSTTNKVKPVLHLDKRLAPIKVAVFPIVRNNPELVQIGKVLAAEFRAAGLYTVCDASRAIGKRYVDHDEMGTPFCVTVDDSTLEMGTVTVRSRDTAVQESVLLPNVVGSLIAVYKN